MLHDGVRALVVDPGDAAPVLRALQAQRLQLEGILVTHHHGDHVGGLQALQGATQAPVYGPAVVRDRVLHGGEVFHLLGREVRVLALPGHTLDHLGFYLPAAGPEDALLFCGDTLFSAGCGRLFEGSPAQMYASLQALAAFDDDALVCCAHEYTLSNLRFAAAVEPENADIGQHLQKCTALRSRGCPTLPSRLGLERRINPFLRCHDARVQLSARQQHPGAQTPEQVFTALRAWKNHFA